MRFQKRKIDILFGIRFPMPKRVLEKLLDNKKAAVLRVMMNASKEMYLKEIAAQSNVSISSTLRILQELVSLEILEKKVWMTSKVYLKQQNQKVDFLKDLFVETYDGVDEFVKSLDGISGIQQIILHGSRKKGKANVLLLGKDIDVDAVEKVSLLVKDKGFDLSYLTLTKEQYEQMAKMGLYSGEKQVLKGHNSKSE